MPLDWMALEADWHYLFPGPHAPPASEAGIRSIARYTIEKKIGEGTYG